MRQATSSRRTSIRRVQRVYRSPPKCTDSAPAFFLHHMQLSCYYQSKRKFASNMDHSGLTTHAQDVEARHFLTWQKKQLPVMVKMVIGLTIFFFAASFIQLFYLH